ncbi:MAG: hypothetical protein R2792_08630 [Saprospiraceae bacterium]
MKTNLFFLILLVLLTTCKDGMPCVENNYCACCDELPVTDEFDIINPGATQDTVHATVYFPNLMVSAPNLGIEKYWIVAVSPSASYRTLKLQIFDDSENVLFSATNLPPNEPVWDGIKPDGTEHFGPFHFICEVQFIDGQIKEYTGNACRIECGPKGFPKENIEKCGTLSQNDNGTFNPDLPTAASTCIE